MTPAEIAWLRRLLEDAPAVETEQAVASGQETDFYVGNPPITGDVTVALEGVVQTLNTDYSIVSQRTVRFATAPAFGTNVTIRYERQTFTDAELQGYLDTAGVSTAGEATIYRAAVYALDTLLFGAATALDFGAGAENYNMTSVFQRLMQLREMYAVRVSEILDSEGIIVVREMLF